MGNEEETLTTAGIKYSRRSDVGRFDEEGNYECVRCGWTHSVRECAEYRLALANKEMEKVHKFLHTEMLSGADGESPVDTLLRWYKIRAGTEVTDLMKEE